MKKIMFILIITTLGLSFNSNASSIYEGKWYQFTSDFIQNCFDGFEATQEGVNETYGKTSSFANSLTRKDLSDCMPSAPYLDTDPQVDPLSMGSRRSCQATFLSNDKMNLPSASDGQTIELSSADGRLTAKYKCNNGSWTTGFDRRDLDTTESNCPATCLSWDADGVLTTCGGSGAVLGNVNICGAIVPSVAHNSGVKVSSGSNYYVGNAVLTCNNGTWNLLADTSSCQIQTCQNNRGTTSSEDVVFWSDREAIIDTTGSLNSQVNETQSDSEPSDFESNNQSNGFGEQSLNELRNELSILSAAGKNTDSIVQQILSMSEDREIYNAYEEESNETQSGDSTRSTDNPFIDNPALRERVKCSGKIISGNGLTGRVEFTENDTRIFRTRQEAEMNHRNIIGEATFNCVQGQWKVNDASAVCRRNTTIDCTNTRVVAVEDGEQVLGYFCQ